MPGKKKAARKTAPDVDAEAERLLVAYRAAMVRQHCTVGPERDALTRALVARGATRNAVIEIMKKREPGLKLGREGLDAHLAGRCSCRAR